MSNYSFDFCSYCFLDEIVLNDADAKESESEADDGGKEFTTTQHGK